MAPRRPRCAEGQARPWPTTVSDAEAEGAIGHSPVKGSHGTWLSYGIVDHPANSRVDRTAIRREVSSQSYRQAPAPIGMEPPETGTSRDRTERGGDCAVEADRLAGGKKNAARLAAHIVFVDESGFLLIPTVRKTWGPVGQTPILRHCYRHDRISAISGIAVSPRRFHCTLYCQLFEDNIQGEEAALFLRHLLHQIPGHLIVLWDNGKIHRGDPVQELLLRTRRLYLVPFPSYAPELNPDEGVWNHLKNRLANGRPDTQAELMDVLADEICRLAASPGLLRSCIQHSELPPFLP